MKNFTRKNQLFSLCGLNCGLCPMYLGKHCGGCGNGNQSCKIARCSLDHGKIEYCYECENYICERYNGIDEFDSFITHKNQIADLEKAKIMGIKQYNNEQLEKIEILNTLLNQYNDGRKKTFYCVAVNILDLSELRELMSQISQEKTFETLNEIEKCNYVYELFQSMSKELNIDFKLRRKK